MRNLAEVCSIKSVETIIYKDQEYTKVKKYTLNENAYEFVAQAGFDVGDKVIFIGEGALVPASNKDFEFLRAKCYSPKFDAFRIKPQKMCGIISMGILMPMFTVNKGYKIGTDLTDVLKIQKYEDAEEASPKKRNWFKSFMFKHFRWLAKKIWKKGGTSEEFPSWLISKTDEDNIQNKVALLEKFKDSSAYISVKMEGCSGTFILDKDGKFLVCSRNCLYSQRNNGDYWTIAIKYNIEGILKQALSDTGHHFAIQGEICGPTIQSNIYHFNTLHLFVFNVKNIDTNEYLGYGELKEFCQKYNLTMVPVIKTFNQLSDFITADNLSTVEDEIVEQLSFVPCTDEQDDLEKVWDYNKKIDNKKKFHHEGIVIRTQDMKFSCKFKSKEYALWFSGKEI